MEDQKYNTGYLFSTPSFISGAASAFDLFGNFFEYNTSDSETEADCKAIKNDFNVIGNDMRLAIKSFDAIDEK